MANPIPAHTIQEIVNRTDIVEVIQARVQLIKRGHNFIARCPFHEEKSPSFTVSGEKQFYYCFGCGVNGNVIGFLMAYDRMEFLEALNYLAAQHGIELNPTHEITHNQSQPQTEQAYQALQQASSYYAKTLRNTPQAIDYLKSRQLTGEICQRFAVGYAPNNWENLNKHLPATLYPDLIQNGLLISKEKDRYYDRFRNRIIFPIHDLRGRIIAFGGRSLGDEQPKYLNSPETPLFQKNRELYGLYQARQANRELKSILVVEGYLDVITLHQHQFTNAVATMGTAINAKHVQKLLRYTNRIIFCFDGDTAGQNAAWKSLLISLPLLRDGIEINFLLLEGGHDPDSFLNQYGSQGFRELLTQTIPLPTYFFNNLQQQIDITHTSGKAAFAKQACEHLNTMPTGIYRHLLFEQLAGLLRIDQSQLQQLIQNPTQQPSRYQQGAETSPLPRPKTTQALTGFHPRQLNHPANYAISLLIHKPELATMADIERLQQPPLPEKLLLIKLLRMFCEQPSLNIGELLAGIDTIEERQLIAQLAARELFIPEPSILEEYQVALQRLFQQDQQHEIQLLIQKAKQQALTPEEKQQLQSMLAKKHQKKE